MSTRGTYVLWGMLFGVLLLAAGAHRWLGDEPPMAITPRRPSAVRPESSFVRAQSPDEAPSDLRESMSIDASPAPAPGFDLSAKAAAVRVFDATPGRDRRSLEGARIRIVSEGGARDGAHAAAFEREASSDQQGRALLEDVPSGVYQLHVECPDFAPLQRPLEVRDRRRTTHVGVLAVRGAVNGRVVDFLGQPVGDALVCLDVRTERAGGLRGGGLRSLRPPDLGVPPYTHTDERGLFELGLLAGFEQQSLVVCPGRQGMPVILRHVLDPSASEFIQIRVPDSTDVVLSFDGVDGRPVAGEVTVTDGHLVLAPLQESVIGALPESVRPSDLSSETTGRTTLRLASGGYKIRHTAPEGARRAFFLRVDAGQGRVEASFLLEP